MGQNKNANFSKRAHGPIFKFCVVIREVILPKMAPILDPVNFFSVLTLISHCAPEYTDAEGKTQKNKKSQNYQPVLITCRPSLHTAGIVGTRYQNLKSCSNRGYAKYFDLR